MTSRSSTISMLIPIVALAVAVVVVDLVVKAAVSAWIGPGASEHARWLISDTVGFEYVRNSGAAFGMFQGNPELLAALALTVSTGFVWLIITEVRTAVLAILSSGLLAGGATGNIIERVAQGYVTDFVALGPWPRFNVADSAITVGVLIFAGAILFGGGDDAGQRYEGDNKRDG